MFQGLSAAGSNQRPALDVEDIWNLQGPLFGLSLLGVVGEVNVQNGKFSSSGEWTAPGSCVGFRRVGIGHRGVAYCITPFRL